MQQQRIDNYIHWSRILSNISDPLYLIDDATPVAYGINGGFVYKNQMFIKALPIPAKERGAIKLGNLYDLPTYYHYGVGSYGFSVWRELDIHLKTTQWVLNGETAQFPLLYGWKVVTSSDIPHRPPEHWPGWPAPGDEKIQVREDDLAKSNTFLLLFLEFVPYTVADMIVGDRDDVNDFLEPMLTAVRFLNSKGIVHFDSHTANFLVDRNGTVMLTDFGLSADIATVTGEERQFLLDHSMFDVDHTIFCFYWNYAEADDPDDMLSADDMIDLIRSNLGYLPITPDQKARALLYGEFFLELISSHFHLAYDVFCMLAVEH